MANIPSKADALRAMREANYSAKSSEVGKPAPRMSTPSAARGKPIGANDMPSPETSGTSESNSAGKRPKSSAPDHGAPHNSGERLSKGEPTKSGADPFIDAMLGKRKTGRPRIGEMRDRPWEAAGMSRSTWYRRKAEEHKP